MKFDELKVGQFIHYDETATGREYIYYVKRKGSTGVTFFGYVTQDGLPLSKLSEMYVHENFFTGRGGSRWPDYTKCEDCSHKFIKHILENSLDYQRQ
jgi:hypothetical protein